MSSTNQTGFDKFSEYGATGFLLIVAFVLAIFMPWIIFLYIIGAIIWTIGKVSEMREDKQRRNDLT